MDFMYTRTPRGDGGAASTSQTAIIAGGRRFGILTKSPVSLGTEAQARKGDDDGADV
jgi:hypothetical protein